MPTLVIPGAYQVSIHGTVSGQEIVTVLGVTAEGFGAAPTIPDKVHAAWTQTVGPIASQPSAYKMSKIKVTDLVGPSGEVFEKGYSTAGTGGSTMGPLSTCAVIRIGAGTRSRSGKGRVYHGPLPTAAVASDGRTISSTYTTPIQAQFDNFRTSLSAAGLTWVVLSRKLSIATPVTSVSLAAVIGTQRRRLR